MSLHVSWIVATASCALGPIAWGGFKPAELNEVAFSPTNARFVRTFIAKSHGEPCIDELDIYGPEGSENLALATTGYQIHQVIHLNDGLYGSSCSWIAATAPSGPTPSSARSDSPAFGPQAAPGITATSPLLVEEALARVDGESKLILVDGHSLSGMIRNVFSLRSPVNAGFATRRGHSSIIPSRGQYWGGWTKIPKENHSQFYGWSRVPKCRWLLSLSKNDINTDGMALIL